MSRSYDVIVVGGGVIGASVAYHLARRKVRVAVVERELAGDHGQASAASAGMLAAQEEASASDAFFDLCMAARTDLGGLASRVREESGINPDWEASGVCRIAADAAEKDALLEKARWQGERGWRTEWWEPDRVKEMIPSIFGPMEGALFCPADGQVHSGRWLQALTAAARAAGAAFIYGTGPASVLMKDGRAAGVRTAQGDYAADAVVLAAGAWTGLLAEALGLRIPVEPVKGQVLVLSGIPRSLPCPVFAGTGYIVPRADGQFIVGATMERVGFDAEPTMAAQRSLADWVERWFPSMTGWEALGSLAGFRPASPDGWPVMGPVPDRGGLYLCTGHFRNGILLSAFSGRFMADGIAEGNWDPLGRPFFPGRFLSLTGK